MTMLRTMLLGLLLMSAAISYTVFFYSIDALLSKDPSRFFGDPHFESLNRPPYSTRCGGTWCPSFASSSVASSTITNNGSSTTNEEELQQQDSTWRDLFFRFEGKLCFEAIYSSHVLLLRAHQSDNSNKKRGSVAFYWEIPA